MPRPAERTSREHGAGDPPDGREDLHRRRTSLWGPMERDMDIVVSGPAPDDALALLGGTGEARPVGLAGARPWQLVVKRAIDVVLAAVLLVVLLPLLALTAVLVMTTTPGPALFRQERVGRDGRRFRMLKLRSMFEDAPARRAELEEYNEADGPVFKISDDPRVTPIGRILRKLSIDELPQLWNVIKGDMSLVGPRPPLPEEVSPEDWLQQRRLSVTPGLTCIWQVSGRSHSDYARWLEMDLEYIRNWSLRLDLVLLVRTVPVVLVGRGAC